MLGDDEIAAINEEIEQMEKEMIALRAAISEKKREQREAKYGRLRDAVNARRAADAEVVEELKRLGLSYARFGNDLFRA